jgi:hypothetical protein
VQQVLENAPAPSQTWYEVTQNGYDSTTGMWLFTAFKYVGGSWQAFLSGELSQNVTQQDVFGEASNPADVTDGSGILHEGHCHLESNPSTSRNIYSSLQLLTALPAAWANWTPATGYFANLHGDNGYSSNVTAQYTDMQVGGCTGCP